MSRAEPTIELTVPRSRQVRGWTNKLIVIDTIGNDTMTLVPVNVG